MHLTILSLKTNLLVMLASLSLYFAPIYALMFLLGTAVLLDTFAGRWCAKRLAQRNGENVRLTVTSKKTRQGLVSKMITYQSAILLLFVLDSYMLNDVINYIGGGHFPIQFIITKFVGLVFLWVEFDSFDEKYYLVKGVKLKDKLVEKFRLIKKLVFGLKTIKDEVND